MQVQQTRYGYVLRMDRGEEIVRELRRFAADRGVRAGMISGLGAVSDVELGFFVPSTGEYVRRTFAGDHEIGCLTGNFSELDGEPFPHCHLVIAGEDFGARAGHLFRAVVSVTGEVQVVTDPGVVRRVRRPGLAFSPLELDAG